MSGAAQQSLMSLTGHEQFLLLGIRSTMIYPTPFGQKEVGVEVMMLAWRANLVHKIS